MSDMVRCVRAEGKESAPEGDGEVLAELEGETGSPPFCADEWSEEREEGYDSTKLG